MAAYRATGHRGENRLAIGVATVVAALLLVVALAEHGTFNPPAPAGTNAPALPGVTLGDSSDRMPVVTSVRSNGEAERLGIRAGDEIEAIDGRRVNDVAGLRAAMLSDRHAGRLALHIRRGDALWTVALDRAEPPAGNLAATDRVNDAENPSD